MIQNILKRFPPQNWIIEEAPQSIRFILNTNKRWVGFWTDVLNWVMIGVCGGPIFVFVTGIFLLTLLPNSLAISIWVLLAAVFIFFACIIILRISHYFFVMEVITIDSSFIVVEKHGLGLKIRAEYPASNIRKVTAFIPDHYPRDIIRFPSIMRLLTVHPNMMIIEHHNGLKKYHSFARGLSLTNAQSILETIYSKYPQYKG